MIKFILRRILVMIPQLIILSVLVFGLAKLMPGDALTGQIASNPKITPQQIADLRHKLGLDQPWYVQYVHWINNLLHGNLGMSYIHQQPVKDLLVGRMGNTILLSLAILVMLYVIAIPLGIVSGRWNDTYADKLVTGYSYLSFATPVFIFALVVLFIFAFKLNLFPSSGSVGPLVQVGSFDYYLSKLNHLILPTFSGAIIATAGTIQFLRSEIVDTKIKDFTKTARAKGVPESRVYSRHVLRNSFLPIAAFLGYEITGLIGGNIFLESIFGYPGMGQLFVQSISQRDFSVVTILIMMFGLATLVGTLLSDIILSIVDPRIRIE